MKTVISRKQNLNTSNQKNTLDKVDEKLYKFLIVNKVPLDLVSQKRIDRNIRIIALSSKNKSILTSNKKIIPIEQIKQIYIHNKDVGKRLIKSIDITPKFFQKFKNSTIVFDYIKEDLSIHQFKGKLKAFLKYQIAIETSKSINLVYKIAISSFSFIEPYPQELIENTDYKENWKPGKWREEYQTIEEILNDEITDENKIYKIYIALKDGRNITGFLKKKNISSLYIRLFANDMKKSIFIFKHAIDDILDIETVEEN